MKIFIVCEYIPDEALCGEVMEIKNLEINDCTGCWTCWWKTPGRCIYKELDQYYKNYITADKVIFYLEAKKGFVSREIKALFDRTIPLFLPYCSFHTGESMHDPRYEKYPDIVVKYKGDFISLDEDNALSKYLEKTFYQFHSKNVHVESVNRMRESV